MLKSADYDALGRMKTIEVGETTGGATLVTNTYSYDATNARLTRVQGAVPGSTPLDLLVAFDGLGRLSSQTGTLGADSVSRSYSYDGLSRLKTAVGPWEKATGATGNVTWTYSYDALGNLRGQASTRTPSNLADVRSWSYAHTTKPRFLSSFAQANQPTETLAATAGGEVSTISRPSLPTETLLWNALGKLYQHKSSTYSYDAFGQRTLVVTGPSGSTTSIVSVGEDFEYDILASRSNKHFSVQGVRIASLATSYTAASASMPPSLRIAIRVVQPLAAPAAATLLALGLVGLASLALRRRTPVWLSVPGVSVLSFTLVALPYTAHAATLTSGPGAYGRHGEPILAYLVDHLGTIRGAVNQAGAVVETRDYAPFGESIAKTGTFAVQHRFTGQPQDDQAGGLYDYGARFYNPKWGRFVSPDEAVQGFDAQGLNPFTYVLNRPTSATDPSGEFLQFPPISIPLLSSGGAFASSLVGAAGAGGLTETGVDPCQIDACPTRPEYEKLGGDPELLAGLVILGVAGLPVEVPAAVIVGGVVATGLIGYGIYRMATGKKDGSSQDNQGDDGSRESSKNEHTKGARKSTENKHEKGQARQQRDSGKKEKGDSRRPYQR